MDTAAKALEPLLNDEIKQERAAAEGQAETRSSVEHQEEVDSLNSQIKNLTREVRLMRSRLLSGLLFLLLLAGAIAASIWAVNSVPNAETKVLIEYNIGEIIGAILAGTGAAAAGLAYAARTLRRRDDE